MQSCGNTAGKLPCGGNLICLDHYPGRVGRASSGPLTWVHAHTSAPCSAASGTKSQRHLAPPNTANYFDAGWWQVAQALAATHVEQDLGFPHTFLTTGITRKQLTAAGESKLFCGAFRGHMPCSLYTEIFWSCGRTHQIRWISIGSHNFYTLIPEWDATASQTVFICILRMQSLNFPLFSLETISLWAGPRGLPSPERAVTQTQPNSSPQLL